jgi:hypothetical protein
MMVFDETQGYYSLNVTSPDALPACAKGATITFRVNGKDTGITATNDLVQDDHQLNLQAP